MKSIIVALTCLLTVSGSQGQTTPPSGMPVPTTLCGNRALKCWTNQDAHMDEAVKIYYFKLACQFYKNYTDCYNNVVRDSSCTKEPEVWSIGQKAAQNQGGICYDDGTLTQCGTDLQSCLNDMLTIKDVLEKKNATATCAALNKFMNCAETARSRLECQSTITDVLDKLEAGLKQEDWMSGCNGKCGPLIGQCTGNLTSSLVSKEMLYMDWKKFCKEANTAILCLSGLNSKADCVGNDIVKKATDSQQLVIRDYCDANSNPSPCITQVKVCIMEWMNTGTGGSLDQQCQASANLLECTTILSACSADVNQMLFSLRSEIDTVETTRHCPYVGTCSDRMATCGTWQQDLDRVKNTSQYCIFAKTGQNCYNYVRRDSLCAKENITVSNFEKTLSGLCGGNGAPSQRTISAILVTAVLFLSVLLSI